MKYLDDQAFLCRVGEIETNTFGVENFKTKPTPDVATGPVGLTGKEIFHEFCKTIVSRYGNCPSKTENSENEASEAALAA